MIKSMFYYPDRGCGEEGSFKMAYNVWKHMGGRGFQAHETNLLIVCRGLKLSEPTERRFRRLCSLAEGAAK